MSGRAGTWGREALAWLRAKLDERGPSGDNARMRFPSSTWLACGLLSIGLLCAALVPALALAQSVPANAHTALPPGEGPWVVRATFSERGQVDRFAAEVAPWEVHHDQRYIVVAVDRAGFRLLLELGFVPRIDEVMTADWLAPHVALPGQLAGIPGFPCYRTVEETFAAAQTLVTAHPTLATWIDVGDSWVKTQQPGQGYDLRVLKLTNAALPGPKPKLFVLASIHAREYTPAELVTRFGERLVNQYGSDPDVTWILDHHEVHLLLQGNPDGRKRAETGLSWRKNADNNACANSNSRGVDLNRNFNFLWNCCGGSSASTCSETYHGPSAGSEPETQAVQNYVRSIFPDYGDPQTAPIPSSAAGVFIDIHSYSQLVIWPWGWTFSPAPNASALQTLGRKLAYFNGYTPEQDSALYITDGATDDFAYGDLGVASYTFELGTAFFQSCTTFENTVYPDNLNALMFAAKVARRPYELPTGPDARALLATPAAVQAGQNVVLDATVDDTRFNNSQGVEPTQNIAAAELYVDTPPWVAGAVAVPMNAVDGSFSQPVEAVRATLTTTAWSAGRHSVFVRGRDAAGNWGPVTAVFVDVATPVELQTLTLE